MSIISIIFLLITALIELCLYIINRHITTEQICLIVFCLGMILNELCIRIEYYLECKYCNIEEDDFTDEDGEN